MKILVINSGSSTIKYQLIEMPNKMVLAKGLIECIGTAYGYMRYQYFSYDHYEKVEKAVDAVDHLSSFRKINNLLLDFGVIKNSNEISAIGHRVVHGGHKFIHTIEITQKVKEGISKVCQLAPLHNPANLMGINISEKVFPKIRQFAVFDTAFHNKLTEKAYFYALPSFFYNEHDIRVYGFHGISHKYVYSTALVYLNNNNAKIITIHLGNGASMAAIKNGISIDTTMGFGPNSGLIMGTRSGDIDPTIIFYLLKKGYSPSSLDEILNKKSGMIAMAGQSDMRDLVKDYKNNNSKARLAYDIYTYNIKKYIGAYVASLNGIDAIVFTGGVGENDAVIRHLICKDLDFFNIYLNDDKNLILKEEGIKEIQTAKSNVKILIIPTNEEFEIAKEVIALLCNVSYFYT